MGIRRGVGMAVLLIAAAPVWAMAQGRQAIPPGDSITSPAEIQRMLDGYMLVQAQEMLQLSDEQFPQFLSRVRALQETRRRTQSERLRMLQELRRTTAGRSAGPIDEGAITERLRALDELETRAAAEINQQRSAVDQVLTPVQQARFRIFEETMEHRKIELLMRARQGRGRQAQPDRRPLLP